MSVDSQQVEETLDALKDLPQRLDLWRLIYILALILGCVVVSRIILAMVGKVLKKSRLDKGLHTFIRSMVRVVLGLVSVLIVVDALGIPITSLVALFSIIGLALSLAAQGILSNVAGGLVVLWSKPFQAGDFVEIDGISGTVKDVTLMYTQLNTTDNRLVYLTNKQVSESTVVNFSAEGKRRVEFTIQASYDSDMEQVKSAIQEVIGCLSKTLPTPAPIVRVGEFGSSAISYHVRCWCAAQDYWDVYYDLQEGIKRAFDERGLEMTYDHLNVHMIQEAEPPRGS